MRPALVSLALLGSLAGCGEPAGLTGGIVVGATMSPQVLTVGEEATVTVRALNLSVRAVDLRLNGCLLLFQIEDAEGDRVAPGPWACPAVIVERTLQPREALELPFRWSGETLGGFLAPGEYRLVGVLNLLDDPLRGEGATIRLVEEAS